MLSLLVAAPEQYFKIASHRCDSCGKAYNQSYNLSRHVKYECGKKPQFQCPFCVYKCKRKDTLKKHCIMLHSLN
ncbi:hypothetical protein PPYR_10537, partial [Photinus pyralis]